MFENPRRGRQAKNFATTVPKILDLKSSSEQIFSENCRWVPLISSSVECEQPLIACRVTLTAPEFLLISTVASN